MKLLLMIIMLSPVVNTSGFEANKFSQFRNKKTIPERIELNVLKALSYYPELKNTTIEFLFKADLNSSVMQAQPVFRTLLLNRKNRRYQINISSQFRLISSSLPILEIPDDVMIGWIGHELGHILDYEGKSNYELVSFGYQYYFSSKFVKHAEMVADSLAVERGMGNFIVATKRYILDHAELPQAYKDKISRLYLSPDVIVEQVKKLEEKLHEKLHEKTDEQLPHL